MRDDRARLLDIIEAIERIDKYAARGRQAFEQEELVQTWIVHHLILIGEAAAALSDVFCGKHPEDIWREAIGRRNILIHQYFGINLELVWLAVVRDLPVLTREGDPR